ncbi:MAG TPA: 4-hydroxythreonine-4-phosphate dehydrogenase, partial [Acetobacteraceae bacterium]|nr:4-hydroxythreonine-4-phosphate dehydrogenase [Acetobacteraceae bacterium]
MIAVTMGDAAGIGPEVIMKALAHREIQEGARALVIGDAARLEAAGRIVGSALALRAVPAAPGCPPPPRQPRSPTS